MKAWLVNFFDIKFWKFAAVGVLNTIVGAGLMFLLYDFAHFGYWGSSAVSYILSSIMSFFLNKKFTFANSDSIWKTALKFSLNIAVCYLLAYSAAKPFVAWILSSTALKTEMVEQLSMLFGMCLFVAFNYIGQRFFAFRNGKKQK